MQEFDKYKFYTESVQSPEEDAKFLREKFWELTGRKAHILVEDFSSTFAVCCEWVKADPQNIAYAVDISSEALGYGKEHYMSRLTDEQKSRLKLVEQDVRNPDIPEADLINALNFSYFTFKKRKELKEYFARCFDRLKSNGILLLDCFGGPECHEPNEQETEHETFSYYWDQDTYNPVRQEAEFYIHFQRKGEPKREKVFSYDWRLWSIPEIRDLMEEVGFADTKVYWEGTDEDGDGNGEYYLSEEGEPDCESWVAYIAGIKK